MIEDDPFPEVGCVNVLVPWRVPSVKRREFRPRRLDLAVPSVFLGGPRVGLTVPSFWEERECT